MGKRFNACTPRPKGGGQTGNWWHKVGSAWQNDRGLITVYLDSIPYPDAEGRVAIMLFEPEAKDGAKPAGGDFGTSAAERAGASEIDDEIPF